MFLKSDQEKANKELDCYAYCMTEATKAMDKEDYGRAAAFHANVARSLRQLQVYKENKQSTDMLARFLKDVEREQHNERLLAVLKSGGIKC